MDKGGRGGGKHTWGGGGQRPLPACKHSNRTLKTIPMVLRGWEVDSNFALQVVVPTLFEWAAN
jgi:hypothetical protein